MTLRAEEARAGKTPIVSEPTQSTNTTDKAQTTTTGQSHVLFFFFFFTLDKQTETGNSNENTLKIYRHDKQLITKDDVFLIQAEIGTAEIEPMESNGTTYHDITYSFRHEHGYALICNN